MSLLDKVFGKIEPEEVDNHQDTQPVNVKKQEDIMSRGNTGNSGNGTHGPNVVDFHTMAQARDNSGNRIKVIVIEPKNMDDAQQAANFLDEKRPVILNFERTKSDEARRILDFISGTIYAINGEITNIGSNVFLCAPSNVSVSLADNDKRSSDVNWINDNKTQ